MAKSQLTSSARRKDDDCQFGNKSMLRVRVTNTAFEFADPLSVNGWKISLLPLFCSVKL